MTLYRLRSLTAVGLFGLLAFAVLAFGAVDTWALMVFEIGVFALAGVWIGRLVFVSTMLQWSPVYVPLGIVTAWTAAQYALGLSADPYRTRAEMLKWLTLWLFFVLAYQCFADDSIRRKFGSAMVWFGFGLCVFGLAQNFTSPGVMYWSIPLPAGHPFGPFVNRNHFAALMELIIPTALLLALRSTEQRLIYVVVYGLMVASVIISGSRAGAMLVGAESLIVLAVHSLAPATSPRRRRRSWLPVAGLAAATIVAIAVAGSEGFRTRFEEDQPYRLRWIVAKATWRLFLDRPWSGYGAGTFAQVYPSRAPLDDGLSWSHAHNDILQFAMEWGLMGFAVVGALAGLLLARRWPRQIWLCVILPAFTVLVHSWFDFPLQIPAILAAWLVTVAQAVPAESEPREETATDRAAARRSRTSSRVARESH